MNVIKKIFFPFFLRRKEEKEVPEIKVYSVGGKFFTIEIYTPKKGYYFEIWSSFQKVQQRLLELTSSSE